MILSSASFPDTSISMPSHDLGKAKNWKSPIQVFDYLFFPFRNIIIENTG
jgi:hypothetical protein